MHEKLLTLDDIDVYKNNLFTKQDEFYYENGENYFGSYHQHSNGQAMTEAKHNEDSLNIYRKNQNNKLIKPKPKRLRPITKDREITPSRDKDKQYRTVRTSEGKNVSGTQSSSGGGGGGTY